MSMSFTGVFFLLGFGILFAGLLGVVAFAILRRRKPD